MPPLRPCRKRTALWTPATSHRLSSIIHLRKVHQLGGSPAQCITELCGRMHYKGERALSELSRQPLQIVDAATQQHPALAWLQHAKYSHNLALRRDKVGLQEHLKAKSARQSSDRLDHILQCVEWFRAHK